MKQINIINKKLLKQTLFTVAYYNALGYYPTSFFIWKNFIDIKGDGRVVSYDDVINMVDKLTDKNKIIEQNGMYKLNTQELFGEQKNINGKNKLDDHKIFNWYKEQIQKDKISVHKIKKVKKWAKLSRGIPYLRGLFLTGTLAMKRGDSGSDWDVLVVLAKNRIWLGRLIFTMWLEIVGKRRRGNKIENRFCLNQFVVDDKLKFKEKNEFFSNELLMSRELLGMVKLQKDILQKNKHWIQMFKPNFQLRQIKNNEKKISYLKILQNKLEFFLELGGLAELLNNISKRLMIQKIINNPKTYTPKADIRYSDFFLVFLPQPQRLKIRESVIKMLTKMKT